MIIYAMLYAAAVGVPVLLATTVLAAVLRSSGRAERGVWLAGVLLALALPLAGLLQAGRRGAATGASAIQEAVTGVIGLPEIIVLSDAPTRLGLDQLILVAWLVASGVLALRWMIGAVRLATAGLSWRPGTMDGVSVWRTDRLGPAVAGVLRPRVLVPEWLASMPAERRSLVLLHEQEHIRAGDPWLMIASRIAPVLAPWNPVIWILAARLVRAIELDCDRRVLRQRPDVRAYGTTLIEVSSRDSGRLVALAAFAESEAPLRNRILSMTTPARTVSVVALLTSMVFGVVLMVAAFEIPIPTIRAQLEIRPGAEEGSVPAGSPDRPNAQPERATAAPPTGGEPATEANGTRVEEPPSVEEVIIERRAETARVAARRADVEERSQPPTTRSDDGVSLQPTFTPFTVAPALLNLAQVQRALASEYPTVLRDAGIGGRVTIWFFIDEEGRVRQTRIDQSSGLEALDQAALNVADIYRFSPALNRDERVPVWVSLPITFQVR